MSECDWPPDWPPRNSSDWRPLYPDAIKFLWERFASAETGCDWLYAVLVSGDLPSIQEEVVEGRVVHRPLRCWGKIDFKVSFPIYALHDIEIALGLKSLYADKILVSWSKLGRLYELTVAQPEPAAQPELVEPEPEPEIEIEQPTSLEPEQPPTLRQQMIIAILRDALGDNFTTDDIIGKTKIVEKGWDAERKAPLGDASRRNDYSVPSYKTVGYTIEDYLRRPLVYPRRR